MKQLKSQHAVTYIGSGVWRDKDGMLYMPNKPQTFQSNKTEEEFLNERGDLKFMIDYSQMTINTVSAEEEKADDGKKSEDDGKKVDDKTGDDGKKSEDDGKKEVTGKPIIK